MLLGGFALRQKIAHHPRHPPSACSRKAHPLASFSLSRAPDRNSKEVAGQITQPNAISTVLREKIYRKMIISRRREGHSPGVSTQRGRMRAQNQYNPKKEQAEHPPTKGAGPGIFRSLSSSPELR